MATECTITRSEFRSRAKTIKVTLEYPDGRSYVGTVEVKEFDSGSLGWNLSDKATFTLGGRDVKCQIGLNITAIGSKALPQDSPAPAPKLAAAPPAAAAPAAAPPTLPTPAAAPPVPAKKAS